MTLIDSYALRRSQGGWRVVGGLGAGFVGVAILVGASRGGLGAVDPIGAMVIVAAALCWSIGSLGSRRDRQPKALAMTVAVQMITAGVVLLVLSSALREWQQGFAMSEVSGRSIAALVYLVTSFRQKLLGLTVLSGMLLGLLTLIVSVNTGSNPLGEFYHVLNELRPGSSSKTKMWDVSLMGSPPLWGR